MGLLDSSIDGRKIDPQVLAAWQAGEDIGQFGFMPQTYRPGEWVGGESGDWKHTGPETTLLIKRLDKNSAEVYDQDGNFLGINSGASDGQALRNFLVAAAAMYAGGQLFGPAGGAEAGAAAGGADAATSAAWSSGAGLGGDTLSAMGMSAEAGATVGGAGAGVAGVGAAGGGGGGASLGGLSGMDLAADAGINAIGPGSKAAGAFSGASVTGGSTAFDLGGLFKGMTGRDWISVLGTGLQYAEGRRTQRNAAARTDAQREQDRQWELDDDARDRERELADRADQRAYNQSTLNEQRSYDQGLLAKSWERRASTGGGLLGLTMGRKKGGG